MMVIALNVPAFALILDIHKTAKININANLANSAGPL